MAWIKDIFDMIMAMVRSDICDRETFFRNHVEPLYEKLTQIHKDYITGFQDVRAKIKDSSLSSEELISFIRDRRREYGHERYLAKALALELSKAESRRFSGDIGSAIEDYCIAICGYFSATGEREDVDTSLPKIGSAYSETISLLEAKRDVSEDINFIIEKGLPQAFDKISSAYARLKMILT
jgi:hypothetical protein